MNGFGFEKLVDKLLEYWDRLLPFETVEHFNRGVRLRFGKAVLGKDGKPVVLGPGYHWKISFADDIVFHMVKTTTVAFHKQLLTTKDGKSVIVGGTLKYDVKDVATLLLEVNDPIDAIGDMSQGFIKQAIMNRTWEEILTQDLDAEITERIKKEAKEWGIRVKKLTITNLMLITPSTLINLN